MIVEFLEGREFMTAWVISAAPHRLTLLGQNGREMTVSQSRVLTSQPALDPQEKALRLELLRQTDSLRHNLSQNIDLIELWEILDGEGESFPFATLSSLFYGHSPTADENSAMHRAVFADGLYFKFSPTGAMRHDSDAVEKLRKKREQSAAQEQEQLLASQWISDAAEGKVAYEPPVVGDKVRIILNNFALWGDEARDQKEAKTILSRSGLSPDPQGAKKALVAIGDFSPHENLDLRRLAVPLSFSPEIIAAAKTVAAPLTSPPTNRLDLTALTTLTIDSNGARDLDDAISIKSLPGGRWQIAIHITDVAAMITQDSPLDLAARNRASSIYLPDAKYPMLPTELSEGYLSLTSGDVKSAFSFIVTVNTDGSIDEYSMSPSLIRVDRQLSFSEADALLDEDSDLIDLWDLAQALGARREQLGGINLG
ncbi:MAG: RNB domain-containing ribonuclease, partial [Candidatus Adiutrix sp.]